MIFFLRYFFPFTYFQSSRLNKWKYFVYHCLLEWFPMIFLTAFYNNFSTSSLVTFFLSFVAFINIYEIGYLTNDFFSEKFEKDPRGRSADTQVSDLIVWALIVLRLVFFTGLTFLLNAQTNLFWWTFFAALLITFVFHNVRESDNRLSSFFALSFFRFFAPLILCLPIDVFTMLLPVLLINYSLYRTVTYGSSKKLISISTRETTKFKFTHYINLLPLCIVLALFFRSIVPVALCLHYMLIWILYGMLKKQEI